MDSPQLLDLTLDRWVNSAPLTPSDLMGRVVVLEAFQMLCPGCVAHGIPQAQRIRHHFGEDVVVIGLHTVFEHHEVMTPAALAVFLREYRVTFPVAIDQPSTDDPRPVTMRRFDIAGTPTLIVIDRTGTLRFRRLGPVDDLTVGSLIGELLAETPDG